MENEIKGHSSAADMKMKIEQLAAKNEEAKKASLPGKPLQEGVSPRADLIDSKTVEANEKAKSAQALAPQANSVTTQTVNGVDLQEWAKKKGINWTTDEDVIAALRKSDEEFHKKRQEKLREQGAQYANPVPQYTPPPNYSVPQNYANDPKRITETLARQYNIPVEDIERLSMFNRDMFNAMMQQERMRYQSEMESIRRDTAKNAIFQELSSDPLLKRPEINYEFHKVLEEMQETDPNSFNEDPSKYKYAYEKALANYTRRNLQGNNGSDFVPPTTPPPTKQQGSNESQPENELPGVKEYAKLSLDDKKRILNKIGAR